jgi:cytochrome c oxidase subunit III
MEIGLIVLATMLATLLGWLLRQSFNTQPWVAEAVEESAHQAPFNARPKLVGLTAFLAVATSFFALILSAYSLRMDYGDWIPLTEPQLLWVNTGMLVLASVAFQWTRNMAVSGKSTQLRSGLVLAGVLTAAFLVGQLIAWQQLNASGQYISSNPSNAFFFMLTGIHGLHILGGMYVWARATVRAFGGRDLDAVKHSVELCTIYWHFLLLVWLILFGLMLST